jgi:hypothetical protein
MSLIVPLLHLLNTYQLNSFKKNISVKKLGPRGGFEYCIREGLSRRLTNFRTPTLLLHGGAVTSYTASNAGVMDVMHMYCCFSYTLLASSEVSAIISESFLMPENHMARPIDVCNV